jgi:hypothetical protein
LHPFAQSSQQAQSHLQSGQPSQQSFEQQAFALGSLEVAGVPVKPAPTTAAATARPPNNFVNMINSLSVWL